MAAEDRDRQLQQLQEKLSTSVKSLKHQLTIQESQVKVVYISADQYDL